MHSNLRSNKIKVFTPKVAIARNLGALKNIVNATKVEWHAQIDAHVMAAKIVKTDLIVLLRTLNSWKR
jgi:hypothetical protein